MKQLSSYVRAVGYLNKLFDLINERFFSGELVRPTITIQSTPRAYGHFTLNPENRVSSSALLLLTGNDIETREISIRFDKNNLKWIYEGDAADIAFKRFVHLPETQTIIHMMEHCSTWSGTAADLSNYASSLEYEIKPPDFGRYIKFNISNLSQLGFIVTQNRTYDTRKITITRHVEESPS